jgi:hypothetical protein
MTKTVKVNASREFSGHDPEGWAVLAALRTSQGKTPRALGDYLPGPDGEVYRVVGEELADGPDGAGTEPEGGTP